MTMPKKSFIEIIADFEKQAEKLEELMHRLIIATEESLKITKENEKRLGLLEKAHNKLVKAVELHIGEYQNPILADDLSSLRVEDKTT